MAGIHQSLEDQTDLTHRYWSAAAEDVAESSRDWAAIHSAIRSRAGMKEMGVPLKFTFDS